MTTPKRPRPARKKLGYLLLVLAVALCTGIVGPRLWTHSRYASKIFTKSNTLPSDAEPRVALVLGAGLWNNSEPSSVLHDRILTAVELYKAGTVQKLLMSGDNRFHHYNEPEVMRTKALEMGVPEQDVICDFAGRRTFAAPLERLGRERARERSSRLRKLSRIRWKHPHCLRNPCQCRP